MIRSKKEITFASYEDLFGLSSGQQAGRDMGDRIQEVPLADLYPFQNHPFRVLDDEKMKETMESIRKFGVLNPAIVRPREEGGYEILSGHRRKRGCELIGKDTMPAIVRNYTDDEATGVMVDANIQREDILPSEKAHPYRMKYQALKHQGSKGDRHTADAVGEAAGDSGRTVQRYLRLAQLEDVLLGFVDDGKLLLATGEKLSYLKKEEQLRLADMLEECQRFPTRLQAEQLKEKSLEGMLTVDMMKRILEGKTAEKIIVTISAAKIRSYFPADYTGKQMEEVILSLLEDWKRKN